MSAPVIDGLTWLGIFFCLSQSAMFSGLNLAYFSVSRLRLEVEVGTGNLAAQKVLDLRSDSNFLLTTILWGNVSINVLLTLLSNSVMAGLGAFLFSTIIITLFGEIFPQAFFSRNALKIGARLSPVLRVYQVLLFPVAKPVAMLLDVWLGKEGVDFMRERGVREMIRQHMEADETDLGRIEGLGALNFLRLDDISASQEGEPVDQRSIIQMPFRGQKVLFPENAGDKSGAFLQQLRSSGKKWAVLTNEKDEPLMVVDTDAYLRSALLEEESFQPEQHCHRPIVIRDLTKRLGHIIQQFEVQVSHEGDDVVDRDVVLIWGDDKRIITGADILGRLLSGITKER